MRLIIHAGLHKTATKSTQLLCQGNKDILRLNGICYPNDPGQYQHSWLAWLVQQSRNSEVQEFLEQAISEAEKNSCSTALISGEDFETMLIDRHDAKTFERLARTAGFTTIQWVFVKRDKIDYLDSLYSELSKHGFCLNYGTLAEVIETRGYFAAMNNNYAYKFSFDLEKHLELFRSEVGGEATRIAFDDFIKPYPGHILLEMAGAGRMMLSKLAAQSENTIKNKRLTEDEVEENYAKNFLGKSLDKAQQGDRDEIVKSIIALRLKSMKEAKNKMQQQAGTLASQINRKHKDSSSQTVEHQPAPIQSHRSISSASLHLARAMMIAGKTNEAFALFYQALQNKEDSDIQKEITFILEVAKTSLEKATAVEVIQYYNSLIELAGENTPETIYNELSNAYARNQAGFGGTTEENACWGDYSKHEILAWLHQALRPRLYLEIGVDRGLGLACAKGPAIGIDPRKQLNLAVTLQPTARIIHSSSDQFFKEADQYMTEPLDLVFIDGMHLFEFALRDFIHAERLSSSSGLIVIDDIFPCHPAQSLRQRRTQSWTGDVWKLHAILKIWRPDLALLALNADTTGLLLVAGLNQENNILASNYKQITSDWLNVQEAPTGVICRNDAIPSNHPLTDRLVDQLCRRRRGETSEETFRQEMASINTQAQLIADSLQGKARELAATQACFPPLDQQEAKPI